MQMSYHERRSQGRKKGLSSLNSAQHTSWTARACIVGHSTGLPDASADAGEKKGGYCRSKFESISIFELTLPFKTIVDVRLEEKGTKIDKNIFFAVIRNEPVK